MIWLRRLLSRRRLERDLDRELSFHIDHLVDDLVAAGMTPQEARRRAVLRFGSVDSAKEAARDVRGTRWLEDGARDVRYALRAMRRAKGFTAAAVASLALGIGANAAVFGLIRALLLSPLPVARPHEVFFLNRTGFDEPNLRFSYPALSELQHEVGDVRFGGMSSTGRMQAVLGSSTELVLGQLVTGNWFDVLGIAAQRGRALVPHDDRGLGAAPVAVLSDEFWARRFDRDPSVVGRAIRLNGVAITVVGIAPAGFRGVEIGASVDVWMPVSMQHELHHAGNASMHNADGRKPWMPQDGVEWLTLVARIPGGASSVAQAAARIDQTYRRYQRRQPWIAEAGDSREHSSLVREHAALVPGARGLSDLRNEMSSALFVLMAAVALLLLVACANLANLLLAKGAARSLELAVRSSLGAGRRRLVAQLLTESTLLALAGGAVGLGVGRLSSRALLTIASPGRKPIPLDLPFDWGFLAFAFGASLVTGLLFGLVPALRLSRASVAGDLRVARRAVGAERAGHTSLSRALIVAQVAVSLLLVIGAGLFVRTFDNLMTLDPGFDREHVLVARFDPRLAGFGPDRLPPLYDRLIEHASRVPGVRSASLAVSGPVSRSSRSSSIVIEGRPSRDGSRDSTREDFVSAAHFATVGMRLVRGRGFDERDAARGATVAVVNEAMARQFFAGQDPVGRHFGYGDPTVEIVGVVKDARVDGPREPVPAMAYYPLAQHEDEYARSLYVRVDGRAEQAIADLRRSLAGAEPNLAVQEVVSLGELNGRLVSRERIVSGLTVAFGLLAVAVACLGLYGTVSYSIARRTNEIGIRLALGAPVGAVRWMVLRETLGLTLAGIAAGLCLALPGLEVVRALLFSLSPRDPQTVALGVGLVAVVGVAAGTIPAWRASRIDPIAALQRE